MNELPQPFTNGYYWVREAGWYQAKWRIVQVLNMAEKNISRHKFFAARVRLFGQSELMWYNITRFSWQKVQDPEL